MLQVTSDGLTSTIAFLPRPDQDYGQMICTASNDIGRMARPCVFSVVAAGQLVGGPQEMNCFLSPTALIGDAVVGL